MLESEDTIYGLEYLITHANGIHKDGKVLKDLKTLCYETVLEHTHRNNVVQFYNYFHLITYIQSVWCDLLRILRLPLPKGVIKELLLQRYKEQFKFTTFDLKNYKNFVCLGKASRVRTNKLKQLFGSMHRDYKDIDEFLTYYSV